MTAQTESPSKSADDSRHTRPGPPWRRIWCGLLVLGAAGGLLTVVGLLVGWHALMNSGALLVGLAVAGLILGWLILLVAAVRRSPLRSGRIVGLLIVTVCCTGLIGAAYVVCWQPWRALRSLEFLGAASPAEMRSVCHRSLLWLPDPHDSFVGLVRVGDESSVPYILWALRSMPATGFRSCTWVHGIQALETITNNAVGTTRKAWAQWYAANKHRPQIEWWADGFTAEGYAVSSTGDEASIGNLLRALGRTPWCQPEQKTWLSLNAKRMLRLLDEARVGTVMAQVRRSGTAEQRCGLARYAGELHRTDAEPILLALLGDGDRSVRLWASGVLCRCRLKWLRNPERCIVERYEPGQVDPDEFFAPAGKDAVAAQVGSRRPWTADDTTEWKTQAAPGKVNPGGPERPECVIRIDYEGTGSILSLEGRSNSSGRLVYSRQLIVSTSGSVRELRWLFDDGTDRLYVSIPGFTCLADPRTGKVLWEMSFGTGNCDDLFLLNDYLVIRNPSLTVCDAARGGILASYDLQEGIFGDRLGLVDGRLRAQDSDDRLYVIELPELRRPTTHSTPEKSKPGGAPSG